MSVLSLVQSLVCGLVGVVTLHYLTSPYIIKPHPQVTENITQLTSNGPYETPSSFTLWQEDTLVIENWTKWRLYLQHDGRDKPTVVHPQSFLKLSQKELPVSAGFEWRSEYASKVWVEAGRANIEYRHPLLSSGIYDHYHAELSESGKTVKFVPNFLFGIPQSVLSSLYLGADDLPIRGLFLQSVSGDRIIVQTFMVGVGTIVVWLLWLHDK